MLDKKTSQRFTAQINCRTCNLKSFCLSKDIADSELQMFENIVCQAPVFEDKHCLYYLGDKFENFYIVRSGCVKQIHYSQDGKEQIIGYSLPGELLGINAIATDYYGETAISLKTTTVCEIKYSRFEGLCKKIPGLVNQVLKKASQELIKEHNIRHSIYTKNSEEKLAMFISSLSTRFRLLGYSPYEFQFPMSRGDIANYLGLAIATVSRSSKILVEKGLIEIKNRSVKIKDMDGLKLLAGHSNIRPDFK